MELYLKADPQELEAKAGAAMRRLLALLPSTPETEAMRKALNDTSGTRPIAAEFEIPVLRALLVRAKVVYARHMAAAMQEIDAVLEERAGEVEVPAWLGEAIARTELTKAAGHKYIRKVPKPGGGWRYFYNVTGGHGLGHHEEIVHGAAFRMKHGGSEGHFHVTHAEGDRIRIRHDESGHEAEITRQAFAHLLHREHAEAIREHRQKHEDQLRAHAKQTAEGKKPNAITAKVPERARAFVSHFGNEDVHERIDVTGPVSLEDAVRIQAFRTRSDAVRAARNMGLKAKDVRAMPKRFAGQTVSGKKIGKWTLAEGGKLAMTEAGFEHLMDLGGEHVEHVRDFHAEAWDAPKEPEAEPTEPRDPTEALEWRHEEQDRLPRDYGAIIQQMEAPSAHTGGAADLDPGTLDVAGQEYGDWLAHHGASAKTVEAARAGKLDGVTFLREAIRLARKQGAATYRDLSDGHFEGTLSLFESLHDLAGLEQLRWGSKVESRHVQQTVEREELAHYLDYQQHAEEQLDESPIGEGETLPEDEPDPWDLAAGLSDASLLKALVTANPNFIGVAVGAWRADDGGVRVELEPDTGLRWWYLEQLEKAAHHKYIRRVPTGNPKRPWRYYYKVSGGRGVGHEAEFQVGAKFRSTSEGQIGHVHILAIEGDKVHIEHDETKEDAWVSRATLTAILHREHAAAIAAHRARLTQDLEDVHAYGTSKQQARLAEEAKKYGIERTSGGGRGAHGVDAERRGPGGPGAADGGTRGGAEGAPDSGGAKLPEIQSPAVVAVEAGPQQLDVIPGPETRTEQKSPAVQRYADLLPIIEVLLPDAVRKFPRPQGNITELFLHQAEGAERCLTAWKHGDGFMLSDAAGLGKTNTALAAVVAHGGKRNLIVVPASGKAPLIAQWTESAQLYDVNLQRGAQPEGTSVVSYDELYDPVKGLDGKQLKNPDGTKRYVLKPEFAGQWDTITFDEAHTMTKAGGAYAEMGKALSEQANKVMYLSATPFTNVADMHYLTRLGLGYSRDRKSFERWAEMAGCSVEDGVIKNPRSPLAMAAIAATMHVDGVSLKRDTSMEGVTSKFGEVAQGSLTPEQHETFKLAKDLIEDAAEQGVLAPELGNAFYSSWSRQYWELVKVPQALELAKAELAAGKQVALFTSFKNANHAHLRAIVRMAHRKADRLSDQDKEHQAEMLRRWADGWLKEIDALPKPGSAVDQLVEGLGGPDVVAEIHGNTRKAPAAEQAAYQAGRKRVVVATMARGGTGISLHDTKGDAPRVQVNLSLPWSGREFVQVAGRSHRLGSKSDTTMHWIVGEDTHERRNGKVVAERLKSMGSLTQGDPEATIDAVTLARWATDAGVGAADTDDADEIIRELERAHEGETGDTEAQAARDYFREFGEKRKGGGDVLAERYRERQAADLARQRLEARRAAEQLRTRLPGAGWSFHFDDATHRVHVNRASFRDHARRITKVAGERSTRHPDAGWGWSVPYGKMPRLSEEYGASEVKVDMRAVARMVEEAPAGAPPAPAAPEATPAPTTTATAPTAPTPASTSSGEFEGQRSALRTKGLHVSHAPASRPGWVIVEGNTFAHKDAIKAAGGKWGQSWAPPKAWAMPAEALAKLVGRLVKGLEEAGDVLRKAAAERTYVGEPRRHGLFEVALAARRRLDGADGPVFAHEFVDAAGNLLAWVGTSPLRKGEDEVLPGQRIALKAVVREHGVDRRDHGPCTYLSEVMLKAEDEDAWEEIPEWLARLFDDAELAKARVDRLPTGELGHPWRYVYAHRDGKPENMPVESPRAQGATWSAEVTEGAVVLKSEEGEERRISVERLREIIGGAYGAPPAPAFPSPVIGPPTGGAAC